MTKVFPGGTNNFAPYETTLIRIPKPIKAQLERISTIYKFACKWQDQKVEDDFIASLKRFVNRYHTFNEQPLPEADLVSQEQHQYALDEIERLGRQIAHLENVCDIQADNQRAATLMLESALKLKANSGGAIKTEIKKALFCLDEKQR